MVLAEMCEQPPERPLDTALALQRQGPGGSLRWLPSFGGGGLEARL